MSPEFLLLIIRVLLALVLYSFFGFALYLIWRSVPRNTGFVGGAPEMYAIEYQGERMTQPHLLRPVNLIGRAVDNNIVLADEMVSAHHARITFHGGQWLLEDLGSRNGTYVNDHRLEGPLAITQEDRIQIGAAILELSETAPMPDSTYTQEK